MFFIPGNHDCAFDEQSETLRILALKNFAQNGFEEINDSIVSVCCAPQTEYFRFAKNRYEGDVVFEHPLLKVTLIKVGDKVIKFNLFNTSWHSTLKESIGTMGYPTDYILNQVPPIHNDLSISLLHHPFNWQTPEHSKDFRRNLLEISDIIISGHEHAQGLNMASDFAGDYATIHIESGSLQDSIHDNNSQFNFIGIDLTTNDLTVKQYAYNSQQARYIPTNEYQKTISKNRKLKTRLFQIKKTFSQFLDDPGASFIHSNKDEITLSDIYVNPVFSNVSYTKEKKRFTDFVNSSNVLTINEKDDQFYKVIFGHESSGKTTILKHIYQRYYAEGYFPLYVDVNKFKDVKVEKLKKTVIKELKEQYDELDGELDAIDFDNIVLLIDDFHKLKLKRAKPYLIVNLAKLFKKIIVTGNELMQFDSYTDQKTNQQFQIFDEFDRYILQEFGPTLRQEMITKWYRLGKDYLDNGERNEFYRSVDYATNAINTIIGKNLIPIYPFYLLSILQALESGQADASNNNLHSYYYEMLIKSSLKKAVTDKDDIGFYINVAQEYCYYLFETKLRFSPIAKDDFFRFLSNHNEKYHISEISLEKILETLINGKILKTEHEQNIAINHKYIYYYFVAKFLADTIDNDRTKVTIDLMAERVYREEYSNIILFLTYLSKSQYIIEKLIEKSKAIFTGLDLMRLEEDIAFINDLHKSIPEQVIKDLDVDSARMEDVQQKEEYERNERIIEEEMKEVEDYDLEEDISTIDVLSQMTKAVRTLNIIGHITRKNWGEMVGFAKYNLAEETYLLGLRTLKFYYTLLNNSQDELIEHVKSIINKKFIREKIEKSQVETITKNLIFNLSSYAAFGIIKRVTNSIGSPKLSKTFSDIQGNHPYNSIKIINASIKLDHFGGFPIKEIEQLAKDNEKNPLGFATIQNIVIDYLYMYELEYEQKQQLYSKLNIKLQDQRYIEGISQIKKEVSTRSKNK